MYFEKNEDTLRKHLIKKQMLIRRSQSGRAQYDLAWLHLFPFSDINTIQHHRQL